MYIFLWFLFYAITVKFLFVHCVAANVCICKQNLNSAVLRDVSSIIQWRIRSNLFTRRRYRKVSQLSKRCHLANECHGSSYFCFLCSSLQDKPISNVVNPVFHKSYKGFNFTYGIRAQMRWLFLIHSNNLIY